MLTDRCWPNDACAPSCLAIPCWEVSVGCEFVVRQLRHSRIVRNRDWALSEVKNVSVLAPSTHVLQPFKLQATSMPRKSCMEYNYLSSKDLRRTNHRPAYWIREQSLIWSPLLPERLCVFHHAPPFHPPPRPTPCVYPCSPLCSPLLMFTPCPPSFYPLQVYPLPSIVPYLPLAFPGFTPCPLLSPSATPTYV